MDTITLAPAAPATRTAASRTAAFQTAIFNDYSAHADVARPAYDWAVREIAKPKGDTGLPFGYAFFDPGAESVDRVIDDVHRLMPMYEAATSLAGVFPCHGYVAKDGKPYLMVTDVSASLTAIESLLAPDLRVEMRPHIPFPVVVNNDYQ